MFGSISVTARAPLPLHGLAMYGDMSITSTQSHAVKYRAPHQTNGKRLYLVYPTAD